MDNKLAKISASPHPLKHVDAIIRSLESEYFNLLRDVQRRNASPLRLSIFSIRSLYDFFLNNPRYAWNPIAQTLATENKIKG
jgi:hypothetical protein